LGSQAGDEKARAGAQKAGDDGSGLGTMIDRNVSLLFIYLK
jgi:hypothetical protein